MFRFGIHSREQLTPAKLEGFIKGRKLIALDLYSALDEWTPAERNKLQERMLSQFSLHNRTFKYTITRRFPDFDRLAVSEIASRFPAGQPVRVHDIAVSDGRTSYDFYTELSRLYRDRLAFVASDYAPYVYVLKRTHSARRIVIDDDAHILQVTTPPFVFNTVRFESVWLYPVNHIVRQLVVRLYARPLLSAYQSGEPDVKRRRIDLLCPEYRSCVEKTVNCRFESYDILSGPTEQFDVIRAMNVLNQSYFSRAQLQRGVANIVRSLNDNGLFIAGSNTKQGTVVNGGVFRKSGDSLVTVATSGEGSKHLVQAFKPTNGDR